MTLAIAIGWIGQGCYFSRFLIQWVVSEKAKRSMTPPVFWWLSLAGSVLVGTTAVITREWVLVPAFVINTAIYVRNLTLGEGKSQLGPVPAAILGAVAAAGLLAWGLSTHGFVTSVATAFLVAGIVGQAIWSTRFVLQWWLSERRGESHFPLGFWWLSMIGALLNLAYTSQLETWLFFVAYIPAWFVPLRNLMLEYGRRRRLATGSEQ